MQGGCQEPPGTMHLVLLEHAEDAEGLWYQRRSESSTLRGAQAVVRLPEASADTQPARVSAHV